MAEIQKHEFFNGFDWDAVAGGQMEAPFVPNMDEVNAMSQEDIEMKGNASEHDDTELDDNDQIEGIAFVNVYQHHKDVVRMLTHQATEGEGETKQLSKKELAAKKKAEKAAEKERRKTMKQEAKKKKKEEPETESEAAAAGGVAPTGGLQVPTGDGVNAMGSADDSKTCVVS